MLVALSLRSFSRRPTDAEMAKYRELLAGQPNPKDVLEDIFWAMLNSREFYFNH